MKDFGYSQLMLVLESWDKLRQLPGDDYQKIVGTMLYTKFFNKSQEAKTLFGWDVNEDITSPKIQNSKKFQLQATIYIQSLDAALDMLGPNIEITTEILEELGERHYRHYGVSANLYPIMGDALMETMHELLTSKSSNDFNAETEQAWRDLWSQLTADMTRGEETYKQREIDNSITA